MRRGKERARENKDDGKRNLFLLFSSKLLFFNGVSREREPKRSSKHACNGKEGGEESSQLAHPRNIQTIKNSKM